MLSTSITYKQKLRPLSACLLITAFLFLSYCPLRVTIQDLIKGAPETGNIIAGHAKKVTPVVCQGVLNNAVTKLTVPAPEINISSLALAFIALAIFYGYRDFFINENRIAHPTIFYYRHSIPLYLRNRILLI